MDKESTPSVPSACPACGSLRGAKLRYVSNDKMHPVPGTFEVFEHACCGLLCVWPRPSLATLAAHYPPHYYAYAARATTSRLARYRHKLQRGITRSRFDPTLPLVERIALRVFPLGCYVRGIVIRPQAKLLDVGSGSGEFVRFAKELGLDAIGVELDPAAAQAARANGLDVRTGNLVDAKLAAGSFDVVTLNHTLEHLLDPLETLRECRRILRPDGTLIVQVPNAASLAARLFGADWVGLDIPRHVHSFTPQSLAAILSRAGFSVERRRYVGTPLQFRGSLRYALNRFRDPRYLADPRGLAHNRGVEAVLLPLAIALNLMRAGDAIEMFARPA